MLKLIHALYKIKFLSFSGLLRLLYAVYKYGINVMALLYLAERAYGEKTALIYEDENISYKQLFNDSEKLAVLIKEKYQLEKGQKVGLLCKNHTPLIKSIFAFSSLGADIYLLNAEMSGEQFKSLLTRYDFKLIIYDPELYDLVQNSGYVEEKLLSYHETLPAVNNLVNTDLNVKPKLERNSHGKIVILTGGTTGNFKAAAHRPSIHNFLGPFLTVIKRLRLTDSNTAYIATPIYHGYGVAMLLLFLILGKKIVINKGFNAEKACFLIRENSIDLVTVVPLMISKMMKSNLNDLKTLKCIVSGGAELNSRLVDEVSFRLGEVLYNLYGTSEAGLNIIATPRDLKYSNHTVGRKIKGAKLKILDDSNREVRTGKVGQFCIKNSWSMKNSSDRWIKTGDLGYCDEKGYYFLCGRVDDMIVSAGENVYPIELEKVLISHPQVEEAAVIGINDEMFGQRLCAIVLPAKGSRITKEGLFEWLGPRVARFQMPKDIVFVDSIPYTPLGKLDRKQLKSIVIN